MNVYEIGTRVQTPDGPGVVEYITKRGMPKMGYTVKLDKSPFSDAERVHYGRDEVVLAIPAREAQRLQEEADEDRWIQNRAEEMSNYNEGD